MSKKTKIRKIRVDSDIAQRIFDVLWFLPAGIIKAGTYAVMNAEIAFNPKNGEIVKKERHKRRKLTWGVALMQFLPL